MSRIDFEDDNVRRDVQEVFNDYERLRVIHAEHMKFIIGILAK